MTPTVSTTSVLHLQPHSRVTLWGFVGRHIHALSDETLRRALTYLDTSDLRRVAQVCVRWRGLALPSVSGCGALPCPASLLPWNVLQRVFALLSSVDCHSAARVCARWRLNALCFFSPVLGRRHINDVPGELLDYIFSYLDLDDLRMAAQVCLHWRDHGIDHPTFWRNIEARSATAGALNLLAARLGQSCGRPFSLTIDIEAPLRPAAEKRLMNLITAIMPTVQKLDISLNAFCVLSLWPVLNWHAPEMTTFSLRLYNPDRIMARVPLNTCIFDSLPGKLRDVTIVDVTLPVDHGGFPAFSKLHTLKLRHPPGAVSPFPAYLFEICEDLQILSLHGGRFTFEEKWSTAALEGLSRLTSLDVHVDPLARNEFVARMPLLKDIPIVILTSPPDVDAAYDFLDGVGSPFNVGLLCSSRSDEFRLLVEDDRTGYFRIFIEDVDVYTRGPDGNDQINILFENVEFPGQVQFVKVSLSLWDLLVPYLTHYTAVPRLVIGVDPPEHFGVVRLDGNRLAFVALEILVVESGRDPWAVVPADDIVHFVDHVLQVPRCRTLELRRVLLKGDTAALYKRFDHVTYSPNAHGRPIIRRTRMLA